MFCLVHSRCIRYTATYPSGPIYRKVGDSVDIICNIDVNSKQAEGKNSTYLSFWIKSNRINDSHVRVSYFYRLNCKISMEERI